MTTTTLLDLPTELLDKIYAYLDWDKAASVTPVRPDILNVSLTCRHLRVTVLPLVFQNVTLKLRWADGALVEPALLRMRKLHPHLVRYVRCVYIETQYGHIADPEEKLPNFDIPEEVPEWMDPAAVDGDECLPSVLVSHRKRVNEVASELLATRIPGTQSEFSPADEHGALSIVRQLLAQVDHDLRRQMETDGIASTVPDCQGRLGQAALPDMFRDVLTNSVSRESIMNHLGSRKATLRLEAMLVAMLCLPPSTNSLIFEAYPTGLRPNLQNFFTLHVAATGMQILGDRLQRLAVSTCPHDRSTQKRLQPFRHNNSEREVFNSAVSTRIQAVKTLVLASESAVQTSAVRPEGQIDNSHWHKLASTVTHLELCDMSVELQEFLPLIKGFTNIQDLTLQRLDTHSSPRPPVPHPRPQDHGNWLEFLIKLRRELPDVALHLESLHAWWPSNYDLSTSACRWLQEEAVPVGCSIDFQRETRLAEDFESFLPLWQAEDSVRGSTAKNARRDGKLVDAAMNSRWRTS